MKSQNIQDLEIAIIHEWLVTHAGSERVIEQILKVFPNADLYCLIDILPKKDREFLKRTRVYTSFLQHFLFKSKLYRYYLPFMPLAIEQFDLSKYDIVISNCHAVSKGVITGSNQLHLSYIHTPIRYAWDMQNEYFNLRNPRKFMNIFARIVLHYIRIWDLAASNRPDVILANSSSTSERIKKVYRRSSQVFYPPVDTDFFAYESKKSDYFLTASRLVPYKKIDLIVNAFRTMPDKKLFVIGSGPEKEKIKNLSTGNIEFLEYRDASTLRNFMQKARAFIFAANEDFGIIPLEAQACGTPVIAFAQGGATDTIRGLDHSHPTGVFFFEQSTTAIYKAIEEFESNIDLISGVACRENAERFSNERFQKEFQNLLHAAWRGFRKQI